MRPPVVAAAGRGRAPQLLSVSVAVPALPLALLLHPLHHLVDPALSFVLSVLVRGRLLRLLPEFTLRLGALVNAAFLAMKLRRGTPVVHARHLPGELVEVRGGLSRHEHGGVLARTGQGHVARSAAHVPGMIEIGLVQRAALALVDRAGEPCRKLLNWPAWSLSPTVNATSRGLSFFLPSSLHGHADAIDIPHSAYHAIGETGIAGAFAPGVAGELDAIAGGEHLRPVFGLQDVVLAEIATLHAHRANVAVKGVHVRIGVGEYKTLAAGFAPAVAGVFRDQNRPATDRHSLRRISTEGVPDRDPLGDRIVRHSDARQSPRA